jgi:hypothetical protein
MVRDEALLSDFRRKYAGLSFVGWHWGLLEKWINTKADNKQNSVAKYFSKGFFVINDISNRLR